MVTACAARNDRDAEEQQRPLRFLGLLILIYCRETADRSAFFLRYLKNVSFFCLKRYNPERIKGDR